MIDTVATAYGGPAHAALRDAVARAKAGDPLAPVSVVVPSNYVGIAARRSLGRAGGVAAVTFLTTYRLAELLGAGRVAASGRRPVSTPVLAGAVRATLADDPGHFRGVHDHPATERALVRSHRALSEVDGGGLARLAATSDRAADVVRVHREVRRRLVDRFSDEQDLVDAAVTALEERTPLIAELGRVIVFLPQRATTGQIRLLRALADATDTVVVAGVTGDTAADASAAGVVERLGGAVPAASVTPAVGTEALSVSDADDEVRHAVRAVIDAARAGTPLDRCAVLYGTADPYARLVGDALDAAGVPWFGASVRTAEASLLGRSLLALLALPDHDLSRNDVTAWLAGAPIRGVENRPAPVAAWERAARDAGVVAGAEQWSTRLTRHADDLERDATVDERNEETAWRAERARRDAERARELATFITDLAEALDPGGRARSWSGLASWCRGLVGHYVGGETLREGWPTDEIAAARRIDAAIDRLGDLDGIDPAPSVAAFRRALELELADDLGRHGTFGHGVLVGPVGLALAVELDRTVVLGLAEGSFPARRRDDPLLPDRERRVVGADLPLAAARVDDDHRALLAVLAASESSLLLFPRGDLRRSAERAPSRWLLDTAARHDGVRPAGDELSACGPWFREVPSFVAGLRHTTFPAHQQEYDVRALLDGHDRGEAPDPAVLARRPEVRRAIDLTRARGSSRLTRFDGNLSPTGDADLRGAALPSPIDPDVVVSATRLETWTACPHAYFVRYLLGVDAVEDPIDQYTIGALDRGTLVHEALDRWLHEVLDAGDVPEPGRPWPQPWRQRLAVIADELCDRLEARGLVGRRLYWQRDRRVLLDELDRTLDFDERRRAETRSRPFATELAFGMPGIETPPVDLDLSGGRRIRLRGAIDRLDRTDDGTLVVIDYKTGSRRSYRGLSADDPAPAGRHLQLALYAVASRRLLDEPSTAIRGEYWFVSDKGGFTTEGYDIDAAVAATVLGVVDAIVDGIDGGLFPAHPAAPGFRPFVPCWFCEPDGLGTRHQHRDWIRKQHDDALAPYLEIVGDA